MWILVTLGIITIVVINYALWGRAWLKEQAWARGFFAWIEPIEIVLWKKSETILWARWRVFAGYLISILSFIGTVDLSPIVYLLPERYAWIGPLLPLIISLSGHIAEFLRNRTTMPVDLVAVPEDAPASVAGPVLKAEAAKMVAVAVVKEAKAEGVV